MADHPRGTDELLCQLKVISRLRQHERLSTTGEVVRVEQQNMLLGLRRWWNGESRDRNLATISQIIDSAFGQLDLRRQSASDAKDRVFVIRLAEELRNTMRGLLNLQTTYEMDSVAHSRIEVLVDRIRTQLNEGGEPIIDIDQYNI